MPSKCSMQLWPAKWVFLWLREALLPLIPYKITLFFCWICLNGKHRGNTNLCSLFLYCREWMSKEAGGDTSMRDRWQSSSHSSWSGQRLPRLVPQQWIPLSGICSLCIMQDEWSKPDNLALRCCNSEWIVQNKSIQKMQTSQSSLTLDFPFPMLNPLI